MKFFNKNNIIYNLDAKSKDEVFNKIAELAYEQNKIENKNDVVEAFRQREFEIATGLEDYFAVPHAKSTKILESEIYYVRLANALEWETFDGSMVTEIVAFIIKDGENDKYFNNLTKLSSSLSHDQTRNILKNSKNIDDIYESLMKIFSEKNEFKEDLKNNQYKSDKLIVGICSCSSGLAHTYMAKSALEKAAMNLGYKCKVEAHGILGIENKCSQEEENNVLFLYQATDVSVDLNGRFTNIFKYVSSTNAVIKNPEKMLQIAIEEFNKSKSNKNNTTVQDDDIFNIKYKSGPITGKNNFTKFMKWWGQDVLKHLMTGIGYCIPLLIASGIFMGLSQLLSSATLGDINAIQKLYSISWDNFEWVKNVKGWNGFLYSLWFVGFKIGLGWLFLIIFSAFLAYSMNGKAGLCSGFIIGFISTMRNTGFVGVLLSGLVTGYIMTFVIRYMTPKNNFRALGSTVIVPFFSILISVTLAWWVFGEPLSYLNEKLQTLVKKMVLDKNLKGIMAFVIGVMYAADMGGQINKAANTTINVIYASDLPEMTRYVPAACGVLGAVVSPMNVGLATIFGGKYFDDVQKIQGKTALITGSCGLTEGTIPFALNNPIRVILINMITSGIACTLFVEAGGYASAKVAFLYGFYLTNKMLIFLLIFGSTIIVGSLLNVFFQKIHFHKKTNTKFEWFICGADFINPIKVIINLFSRKNKFILKETKFKKFLTNSSININGVYTY
ncbi:fructose-specific PTS transporter subunit EIIC [Spiroplasma endosymbiont of Aspidapion aeneum]|uniref:fructose-specific PTS transporter subunit EIIC n=1 Tax=Spiroplasma endosymbiont of Aspidapion aeneum TaxID=3066276 RepID=UPI00313C60AF